MQGTPFRRSQGNRRQGGVSSPRQRRQRHSHGLRRSELGDVCEVVDGGAGGRAEAAGGRVGGHQLGAYGCKRVRMINLAERLVVLLLQRST